MADSPADTAKRLLLVDDDAELLRSVSASLSRALDCAIDGFTDGSKAVERANDVSYACALLDMDMPGLNGLQLARALRVAQPTLPILFLTGSAQSFPVAEIDAIGVNGVLAKPVKASVLADRVRAVLDPSP